MKLPGVSSWSEVTSCKKAHWFPLSPHTPPSSSFHDSYLREMLKVMILPNNSTDNIPVLNERSLKINVDAEHSTTKSEIAKVVKEKHK